jgi:hypothetical protein
MKKIAIVGVEGSGKTVMMAAMGEQWERPDERGYFLSPENAEAFGFSKSVMAILRSGRWPNASSHDEMRTLNWSLRCRQGGNIEKIADISMLDYAGEVYRQAFGGEKKEGYDTQVATLLSHVDEADVLIVLVNLSDIINGSMSNRRTLDAMYITKKVLEYSLGKTVKKPCVAIVLSQADRYGEIIAACGGASATLKKYLSLVTNIYDKLPVFTASAIDKTIVDDDGLLIPAPGFLPTGLRGLMDWMIGNVVAMRQKEIIDDERERLSTGPSYCQGCCTFLDDVDDSKPCPKCGAIERVFIRYAMSESLKTDGELLLNAQKAIEAYKHSDWNSALRFSIASKFHTAEVNYVMARMLIDGKLDSFYDEARGFIRTGMVRWCIGGEFRDRALLHIMMMKFLDEKYFLKKVGGLHRRFLRRGLLLNSIMALPGILVSLIAGGIKSLRRPSATVVFFVFLFYVVTFFIPMIFVPFFLWMYYGSNENTWNEEMRISMRMMGGCKNRLEAMLPT